jgi:hypothetical protein
VNDEWTVSAALVTGTSRLGEMPKVVTAQGPTPALLVVLARCLVAHHWGRVPK